MNLIEICIAFIVAIVSIGTPLVFQVISKFEEKYQSEKIIELFKKESLLWLLKTLIIASLVLVLFYIVISNLLVYSNNLFYTNILTKTSYLLLFTTFVLVFHFIYFSFKVLKFSIPASFIKARIRFLKKSKTRIEKEDNLVVVNSFFLYSIRKNMINTCSLIPDYMFYVFYNYRVNFKDNVIIFPNRFYETTYLITQELALSKSIHLKSFDHIASGFKWLIGSVEDTKISNETFYCLWSNLCLIAEHSTDDKIFKYWKQAVHHFDYNLRNIVAEYKSATNREKINSTEISERDKERSEFIEFHYYLGGLLYFKNRIKCIRRIWDHTTSEPPRYSLLPSTMDEIFTRYFKFCSSFNQRLWEKSLRFNFPGVDSINFDLIIHSWIRKYLILLFIRQYTLHKYYVYQDFLGLPKLPESQAEKKHWIENIQGFKNGLEDILSNNEYLKILRFDQITPECEKTNTVSPLIFVDNLKDQLEKEFEQAKVTQSVSKEKEKKFWKSSKTLINEALIEYNPILNGNKSTETNNNNISFYIPGKRQTTQKSDFADEQEYEHFNFDSFVAESLSNEIRDAISETFLFASSQSFLLKGEDLFPAIDLLKIEDKHEDFIIISFAINLEYYKNVLNVSGLSNDYYKSVKLVDIWNCNNLIVGGTFFILKKSDLPLLFFKDPVSKLKMEYKEEEKILENIYATIIDLHEKKDIKEILKKEEPNEDLDNKVLVSIEMNAEICWKKSAKVIAFRVSHGYEESGLPNKIEEVKPFDEI